MAHGLPPRSTTTPRVARVLPDLVVFAIGIGVAWWTGWNTRTLVWSLWLSSLALGYASIVRGIAGTLFSTRRALASGPAVLARWAGPLALLYAVFLLAFLSVHFGGFHWGHSIFLNMFFPIDGSDPLTRSPMPRIDEYRQVLLTCGWFIPLALVAQRASLSRAPAMASTGSQHHERMSAPYRNVVRLHLLIICFAFASLVGVGAVWLHLLVYSVYFFPWHLLPRRNRARAHTGDDPP